MWVVILSFQEGYSLKFQDNVTRGGWAVLQHLGNAFYCNFFIIM